MGNAIATTTPARKMTCISFWARVRGCRGVVHAWVKSNLETRSLCNIARPRSQPAKPSFRMAAPPPAPGTEGNPRGLIACAACKRAAGATQ